MRRGRLAVLGLLGGLLLAVGACGGADSGLPQDTVDASDLGDAVDDAGGDLGKDLLPVDTAADVTPEALGDVPVEVDACTCDVPPDAPGDVPTDAGDTLQQQLDKLFPGIRDECRPADLGCSTDAQCAQGEACVATRCTAPVTPEAYEFSPDTMALGGLALPPADAGSGFDLNGDGVPDNVLASAVAAYPGGADLVNFTLKQFVDAGGITMLFELKGMPDDACGPVTLVAHDATSDLDLDGVPDGNGTYAVRPDGFSADGSGPAAQFGTGAIDGGLMMTGEGTTFPLKIVLFDGVELELPIEGARLQATILPAEGTGPNFTFLPLADSAAPAGANATLGGFIRVSRYAEQVNKNAKDCPCAGIDVTQPLATVSVENDKFKALCTQSLTSSTCGMDTDGRVCENLNGTCLALGVMSALADVATGATVDSQGNALNDAVSMALYVTLNAATLAEPPLAPEFAAVGDTYKNQNDCDLIANNVKRRIGVLANDFYDAAVSPVITAVTKGDQGGVVEIGAGGTYVYYTPPADYVGFDHFTYTIQDATGGTSTGNVDLRISPMGHCVPGAGVEDFCAQRCEHVKVCETASYVETCEADCVATFGPSWTSASACSQSQRDLECCKIGLPCIQMKEFYDLEAALKGGQDVSKGVCNGQISTNLAACGSCPAGTWGAACTPCPGGVDHPCGGTGTCSDGLAGDGTCTCPEGSTWNPDALTCQGADPCAGSPCADVPDATGECAGVGSVYTCTCVATYTWNPDTLACDPPPDPCTPNPCAAVTNATGACVADYPEYACVCAATYTWNPVTLACDAPPNQAPVAGAAPTFTGSNGAIVHLAWNAASDDYTAVDNLEYSVYRSQADNIATVADCDANGTLALGWSTATTGVTLSDGIALRTTYWFTVVVRDAEGLRTAYPTASYTTPDDGAVVLGCGVNQIIVGVYGSAGWWFDGVGVRCAIVTGTSTGTPWSGPYVGGTGGSPFTFDCPSGSILYAVKGNNGTPCSPDTTLLQQYRCVDLATGTLSDWSTQYGGGNLGSCGPSAGGAFEYSCGPGTPIVGLAADAVYVNQSTYVGFTNGVVCQ